jgi:hypothetical protein
MSESSGASPKFPRESTHVMGLSLAGASLTTAPEGAASEDAPDRNIGSLAKTPFAVLPMATGVLCEKEAVRCNMT